MCVKVSEKQQRTVRTERPGHCARKDVVCAFVLKDKTPTVVLCYMFYLWLRRTNGLHINLIKNAQKTTEGGNRRSSPDEMLHVISEGRRWAKTLMFCWLRRGATTLWWGSQAIRGGSVDEALVSEAIHHGFLFRKLSMGGGPDRTEPEHCWKKCTQTKLIVSNPNHRIKLWKNAEENNLFNLNTCSQSEINTGVQPFTPHRVQVFCHFKPPCKVQERKISKYCKQEVSFLLKTKVWLTSWVQRKQPCAWQEDANRRL